MAHGYTGKSQLPIFNHKKRSILTKIIRNQPHVYAELHRYGLQSVLKTSAGTIDAKNTYYTPAFGACHEIDGDELAKSMERVAEAFFSIDDLNSRTLMPYPHDPNREPKLWAKYDNLTAKERLDQIDLPQISKDRFDAMISSLGSLPGSQTGFVEVLRWYALGGHSMAGLYELCGIYKLGEGGMTRFARSVLADYKGHLVLNTVVKKIEQSNQSTLIHTSTGGQIRAKYVISTIPQ